MKRISRTLIGAASIAAAFCLAFAPTPASAIAVNLELALIVDESGSVNAAEWMLQRDGYVAAFQNAAVQTAIVNAGGIAVTYVQFDDGVQQGIGWTHINSAADAINFAAAILGLGRFGNSGTYLQNAIDFTVPLFGTEVGAAANGFESVRQVIDVSGDGRDNEPANDLNLSATDQSTTAAILAGIDRINGLVIDPNGELGLLAFYQTQVQDGVNGFTIVADDFNDFAATVRDKVFFEVTGGGVPEGGTTILYSFLSLGALGLFGVRRKIAVA